MDNVKISPLAKRLAEENSIDWRLIQGTGPEGRVIERDILNYLAKIMSGDADLPTMVDVSEPPPAAGMADFNSLPGLDGIANLAGASASLAKEGVDLTSLLGSAPPAPAPVALEVPEPVAMVNPPAAEEFDDAIFDLDLDALDEEAVASASPEPSWQPTEGAPVVTGFSAVAAQPDVLTEALHTPEVALNLPTDLQGPSVVPALELDAAEELEIMPEPIIPDFEPLEAAATPEAPPAPVAFTPAPIELEVPAPIEISAPAPIEPEIPAPVELAPVAPEIELAPVAPEIELAPVAPEIVAPAPEVPAFEPGLLAPAAVVGASAIALTATTAETAPEARPETAQPEAAPWINVAAPAPSPIAAGVSATREYFTLSVLRRHFKAPALQAALQDLADAVDGAGVPAIAFLARAANRANLAGANGLALAKLESGQLLTLKTPVLEGAFRDLIVGVSNASQASSDAGLLVLDHKGSSEEVVVPVHGALLSLSDLADGEGTLTLSGKFNAAEGSSFLERVAQSLENPLRLMI